jgi:hypothetical protein
MELALNNPFRVEDHICMLPTQGSSPSLATLGFDQNAFGVQ